MSAKSLRIVICVNHFAPSIGGCEYVTEKIARHFADCGHEVIVLTRRISKRKPEDYKPIQIIDYYQANSVDFQRKLIGLKADVILVYSDVFDFFRTVITMEGSHRLFIALCGANWIYKNRNYANTFYRQSNRIEKLICHSKFDRDYKFCSGKLSDKTVVIPNGIDLVDFDSNKITRTEFLNNNNLDPKFADLRWILNVANFFPGKGQEHLIKILYQSDLEDIVYLQFASDVEFDLGKQLEIQWLNNSR